MQDYFVEVVLIMIVSTVMFGVTLYLQYANAARYNFPMMFLRDEH
jgi:hypothetical protein